MSTNYIGSFIRPLFDQITSDVILFNSSLACHSCQLCSAGHEPMGTLLSIIFLGCRCVPVREFLQIVIVFTVCIITLVSLLFQWEIGIYMPPLHLQSSSWVENTNTKNASWCPESIVCNIVICISVSCSLQCEAGILASMDRIHPYRCYLHPSVVWMPELSLGGKFMHDVSLACEVKFCGTCQ